jgi:hypothetical protein
LAPIHPPLVAISGPSELMERIMNCDHSLRRKYILKFILLFYDPI